MHKKRVKNSTLLYFLIEVFITAFIVKKFMNKFDAFMKDFELEF